MQSQLQNNKTDYFRSKCFTCQRLRVRNCLVIKLCCLRDKRRLNREVVLWISVFSNPNLTKVKKKRRTNMNRGNEYIRKERKLCNMNGRGDFIFNILYISVVAFVVKNWGHGFRGPSPCYGTDSMEK